MREGFFGLDNGGAGDPGDHPDPAGLGQLLPDRAGSSDLRRREALGPAEGAAPSDAGEESAGLRREEVEDGVAFRGPRVVSGLPGAASERCLKALPVDRSHPVGVEAGRNAGCGNPPAPFDVAGTGDGLTATLTGLEAGNGGTGQGGAYAVPRQSSTLPDCSRWRGPCSGRRRGTMAPLGCRGRESKSLPDCGEREG